MHLNLELQFAWAAGIMFLWFASLWVFERLRMDAGVVDFGWSAGIGAAALFFAATTPSIDARPWLVAALGALWSLRLASHLLVDRIVGKPEDRRYANLRARWGPRAGIYFFLFFQVQAGLVLAFTLPLAIAMRVDRPLGDPLDLIGVAFWLAAIVGETAADRQLAAFRASAPREDVCQVGLWRYSRHPNYFFEWLHWWTYVVLSIGQPWWAASLLGPVLMLVFLLFVTGIPATEAHLVRSRGDAYRRYQQTTSAFFPWFPRKDVP